MENNFIFKGGLTKYWWIPLITGLLSIGIGIWCLCSPIASLSTLAYVFAIVMCAAGLFNFVFAVSNTKRFPGWGWALGLGLIELICGIWMLTLSPAAMTAIFIYTVGCFLIFAAINAICDSCTFFGYSRDWFGWIIALLLITLLFAVIFIAGPVGGGVAVWLYIGISFITFGVYRLILSAKIRKINRAIHF